MFFKNFLYCESAKIILNKLSNNEKLQDSDLKALVIVLKDYLKGYGKNV